MNYYSFKSKTSYHSFDKVKRFFVLQAFQSRFDFISADKLSISTADLEIVEHNNRIYIAYPMNILPDCVHKFRTPTSGVLYPSGNYDKRFNFNIIDDETMLLSTTGY